MDEKRCGGRAPRHVGAALLAMPGAAVRVRQERCAKVRNRNVECLRCAEACTSGCIALEGGQLVIDPTRCVGCGTCATVCPTCALEAVNPSDAELVADCLKAARPAEGCAPGAGELPEGGAGPVPAAAGAEAGGGAAGSEVVIACSQVTAALGGLLDPTAYAPVVCAGRVDESLLATLAAAGVTRVTVACGRCERCAQRHGIDTARLVADTVGVLLDAWGAALAVSVAEGVPTSVLSAGAAPKDAARRLEAFFAQERACAPVRGCEDVPAGGVAPVREAAQDDAGAGGADVGGGAGAGGAVACVDAEASRGLAPAVAAPAGVAEREDAHGPGMRFYWGSTHGRKVGRTLHVMRDGTLPHFLPDRRERLLDALAALGEPQAPRVACRLWGTVVIDGTRCTSCRMCATFCPTGAIRRFDDEDGALGVEHLPGDCVKCGSCRDICPAGAISLRDEVGTAYLVTGGSHRYVMAPRPVSLADNPHQILDTMRLNMAADIFER